MKIKEASERLADYGKALSDMAVATMKLNPEATNSDLMTYFQNVGFSESYADYYVNIYRKHVTSGQLGEKVVVA